MQSSTNKGQGVWRDRNGTERNFTWRERIASFGNIAPLLGMLWQTSPLLATATIVLRVCRAPLPLLALWIPKLILDAIVLHISQGASNQKRIWSFVAIELAVVISNDILARSSLLSESLLADLFTNRISVAVIRHASTLDLASFEDPLFYDTMERARSQNTSRMFVIDALMNLMQDILSLAVLSTGLIIFSPWIVTLLLCPFIPAIWGESRFSLLKYSALYRWTPYRRMMDYLRFLGASIESAKEVKLFGLGSHLAGIYTTVSTEIYNDNKKLVVRRATVGSILNLLSAGGYYGAYALILIKTLAGKVSLGTFTFLVGSFSRSKGHIERIVDEITDISESLIYLSDLIAFFETQPSIRSLPAAKKVPRPLKQGFEFRHVSFTYPGANRPSLHDVSFTLAPDETLALVGENGAGKTTLVKLLLRLYDPAEGQILLDGTDLRNYELHDLHNNIGIIFQDYMRYDMLVRDNIGFGNIGCLGNHGQIETAARKSGAHELIDRLPKAYEQMLGRRFEGGIALSGGEWQKLALARAYMRDAQLMVLDEPTATLDARAEYELFKHFSEFTRGRMLVLISHRFSTARMADQILVLRNGTLSERGSHGDLIRLGRHYAELYDLQASAYR